MATYKSAKAYSKAIRTRTKNAIKRANNNAAKASIYLSGQLKSTAPRKKGTLAGSVRRRKTKNGYSVLAGYSNGTFNVGRWVNQEFSSRFTIDSFQPFFKTGQTFRYGQSAVSPSNRPIVWTSRAYPWFDIAVKKTMRKYRAGYKSIRAALRGK